MKSTRFLALVAVLTFLVGAVALPAMAQPDDRPGRGRDPDGGRDRDDRPDPDDRPDGRPDPQERREQAQQRRDAERERMADDVRRFERRCADATDNETADATANETRQRCLRAHAPHEPGMKARREAHALMGAIRAIEHKIAKLEVLEMRLRADGNATGNTTDDNATLDPADDNATLDHAERLERIDALQERLATRLAALYERVDRLHAKWETVRAHVAEKRRLGEFEDAPTCDERDARAQERLQTWYDGAVARAEERRDRQLAQDNLTAEQEQDIEDAYQGALARIEAAYAQRQAGMQEAFDRCEARQAADQDESEDSAADGGDDGSDDGDDASDDGDDAAGDGSGDGADEGSGDGEA